jgi:RNA polymerase sigma-70 factor (ECF subfamily)
MDFRTTILPHRDRLYRLALSITLDTADAEDIVQDTMLKAWERREQWPQIRNIESWLTQICKNLALDHKKKRSRIVPLTTINHPSSIINQQSSILNPPLGPSGRFTLEESSIINHQSSSIIHLISQLPPPQDDIVRLRDIEGYSYREIAQQLNLSEDQVRVYLHRARTRLREQYTALENFGLST